MGNAKTYRQYDARWANDPFPRLPDNMQNSGCGPTAIASVGVAINAKLTPKWTGKWMREHGYAIFGAGSAHAGITACMKRIGFEVEKLETMPQFFKAMQKKGAVGIMAFRAGTRGGKTWTTVGHFVACSDYRYKNGEKQLYIRDPGGRKNDGWHSYERHMKGLVSAVWVGVPKAKPVPKVTPKKKKEKKKLDCKSKTIKVSYEIEAGEAKKIKIDAFKDYYQIGIMSADTDDNFVIVKGFDVDYEGGYITLLNLLNTKRSGILKYQCFALPKKVVG